MRISKATNDHLKAVRATLAPVLEGLGFRVYDDLRFYRINKPVIQFIIIHACESSGVSVLYHIFSLACPPRHSIGSICTGYLYRDRSRDIKWTSSPASAAQLALKQIVRVFKSQALPVLDRTITLSGYILELKSGGGDPGNPHTEVEIGCALAFQGKIREAMKYLEEADARYFFSTVGTGLKRGSIMDEFIGSIIKRTHKKLLERWHRQFYNALRLGNHQEKLSPITALLDT